MSIRGQHGSIIIDGEVLPDVCNWTLTRSSDNRAYASSRTAGHTCRVAGRRDWSVSLEMHCDASHAGLIEGQRIMLRLHLHQAGTPSGRAYHGLALIDTVRPVVDLERARVIRVAVTASADGPLMETMA